MSIKIVTVVGARPQFIKAAAISRAIAESNKQNENEITEVIVHTGQHFDKKMSDVFFNKMDIPKPNYFLGINSLSHGAMTGRMIEKIEAVLLKEKPQLLIVYGDTNSTVAGAIAAKKLNIKIAHIESGLRSYNNLMPEEINRILTDRISDMLFCPTENAVQNLNKEGFLNFNCDILNYGDVMYDIALHYRVKAIKPKFDIPKEFILATLHRAENTNSKHKLLSIIKALHEISKANTVVIPLHPRTKIILQQFDFDFVSSRIKFIDPVDYFEMIWLIKNSKLVMTDSGGLQKEAFFFKKKCITLREETEWVELVDNKFNILSGSDSEKIIQNYTKMMNLKCDFNANLYGDGAAAQRIVDFIIKKI